MPDTETLADIVPSATPSEAEIAAWQTLPRDEQLRRLQRELARPDACIAGPHGMADIWDEIKKRRDAAQR